ncbi:hypothetical protein O2W15_09835 [Modestobacter sp. VKM Ac-2979]|uniref:hypothetical protein n=1 Tax=unclassified Modestobacter TaxID=2643866 RepID=UPI0022ABB01E|nr:MULTISPECIES: hypothetical protein [unclassified Modestobacter]MCZ2811737.1 hypothetical protein [Modestobacter sp. VKM Ac-2979]MCZ2843460.1 hypothetical protein [Modestobacter sp. VKM Ac-2980]
MAGLTFSYRLPLSYVRITGTRTETRDWLSQTTTVDSGSAVTTEDGADLLTRCVVRQASGTSEKQTAAWTLLADGRLTGADVATAAEPLAGWKASLSAGPAVMGAAGPPLLAAGPPGWVALAGLTGAAAIGAGIAGGGLLGVMGGEGLRGIDVLGGIDDQRPQPPEKADPAAWKVHPDYVKEDESRAYVLAGYRAAVADATAAHAEAVRAAIDFSPTGAPHFWEHRVRTLERLLASASVGAAHAEAAYADWKVGKITVVSEDHDERLRIDVLPTAEELAEWAAAPGTRTCAWIELARRLQVAVTVRLERVLGDNGVLHQQEYEPIASDDVVHYRQPRPAVLETWKVSPAGMGTYELIRMNVQRLLVAYPGNEATISLRSDRKASSAAVLTLGESGALLKVGTERTDPALQRAHDITALIPALKEAAESGSALRTALSPPSLVERAAEAEAAQELGFVPAPDDPLRALKGQVAEQELRARLRLAEQLAVTTSPPVFMTVHETR